MQIMLLVYILALIKALPRIWGYILRLWHYLLNIPRLYKYCVMPHASWYNLSCIFFNILYICTVKLLKSNNPLIRKPIWYIFKNYLYILLFLAHSAAFLCKDIFEISLWGRKLFFCSFSHKFWIWNPIFKKCGMFFLNLEFCKSWECFTYYSQPYILFSDIFL